MKTISLPPKIIVYSKISQESIPLKTSDDIWRLEIDGQRLLIKWTTYNFPDSLKLYLKSFILHRLQNRSIATVVSGDAKMITELNKEQLNFPFEAQEVILFFNKIKNYSATSIFKSFYKLALVRNYYGFNSETYQKIKEFKNSKTSPYSNVFLRQTYVKPNELEKVYSIIHNKEFPKNFHPLRDNIIVHMSYELAPRRSQLFSLIIADFKVINESGNKYYSINLPMSKKRSSLKLEKRPRKISSMLGEKIESYLELHPKNITFTSPFFIENGKKRLSVNRIGEIFKLQMRDIGLSISLTDMRHHLAQSLADQGASAETIAEIMGHNSTMPARAYITATPKIAEIKASALGKSQKYGELLQMFITGEVIDEAQAEKDKWVQGVIGDQYIGGIGSCGLPNNTVCSKNPVYSCYTCLKFHPFKSGNHTEVKLNLQREVQKFIDISEQYGQLKYNRPISQLENTILAVNKVIEKLS